MLAFVACSFIFATQNIPIIVSLMSFSWGVVSGLITVDLVISLNADFSAAAAKVPEMGVSAMAVSLMIVPLVSAFTRNTETEAERVEEIFNCYKQIQ